VGGRDSAPHCHSVSGQLPPIASEPGARHLCRFTVREQSNHFNMFLTRLTLNLITQKAEHDGIYRHEYENCIAEEHAARIGSDRFHRTDGREDICMNDLIFIAVMIGFFVIAGLYTTFCEKL
jgi:hypothetical protein